MNDESWAEHELQPIVQRACLGDQAALDEMIRRNLERMQVLTRGMLKGFPRVARWTETDDVLQSVLIRQLRAFQEVKPETPRAFFALATVQIRRELIDLARRFAGPHGIGANYESRSLKEGEGDFFDQQSQQTHDPAVLAEWTELHLRIDALAAEEREVVGLLYYQGLQQSAAAELLGVSTRTVQRRWLAALVTLHDVWKGPDPTG